MPGDQSNRHYSIKEAAEYLGLTKAGVKYHIYQSGELVPDPDISHPKLKQFYKSTLDAFKAKSHKPGPKPAKPKRGKKNG